MGMTKSQGRVPKGTPTGGQFSHGRRGEPESAALTEVDRDRSLEALLRAEMKPPKWTAHAVTTLPLFREDARGRIAQAITEAVGDPSTTVNVRIDSEYRPPAEVPGWEGAPYPAVPCSVVTVSTDVPRGVFSSRPILLESIDEPPVRDGQDELDALAEAVASSSSVADWRLGLAAIARQSPSTPMTFGDIARHAKGITEGGGLDLSGVNLAGANLAGAPLAEANLANANLSGANLVDADLTHADLSGADLSGAKLEGASFTDADLYGCDLRGAVISSTTSFEWASLAMAKLPDGFEQAT